MSEEASTTLFHTFSKMYPSAEHSTFDWPTRSSRSISNASATTASDATSGSWPRTTSSSRSSSQTRSVRSVRSIRAALPPPVAQHPFYTSSIDGILSRAVNSSSTSLASLSLDSVRAETRPAAFGTLEEREERAQFGKALEVLEPRNSVGWWGVREVLESGSLEAQLIA